MPVGSPQLGAPLDIPAPPKGASRLVPDDDALIEFADESGANRKFSAAGEVEGGVIREFIVAGNEVRDTRALSSRSGAGGRTRRTSRLQMKDPVGSAVDIIS